MRENTRNVSLRKGDTETPDVTFEDLNRKLTGERSMLEDFYRLIYSLTCFSNRRARRIIQLMIKESKTLLDYQNVVVPQTFQILGTGGYGLVFGRKDLQYCLKYNRNAAIGRLDYDNPLELIRRVPEIQHLTVVPCSFLDFPLVSFSALIKVYYAFVIILNYGHIQRFVQNEKLVDDLMNFEIAIPKINSSMLDHVLFDLAIQKYLPNHCLDVYHCLPKLIDFVAKHPKFNEGSCIILRRAFFSADKMKVNVDDTLNMCGVYPFFSHRTHHFRLLTLHVFLFILHVSKTDFYHRDLKPNNILIYESNPYSLSYEDLSFSFSQKYIFKVNDFGISLFKKSSSKKNQTALDAHFYVHNLFSFFAQHYTNDLPFFQDLFEVFIQPVCNTMFKFIRINKAIPQGCQTCSDRAMENKMYNITTKTIKEFLRKDWFQQWASKT